MAAMPGRTLPSRYSSIAPPPGIFTPAILSIKEAGSHLQGRLFNMNHWALWRVALDVRENQGSDGFFDSDF